MVLRSSSAWNKMILSRESSIPVIKGAILGRAFSTWGKMCCPSIRFCNPVAVAARVACDFADHGLTGDAEASGFHSGDPAAHLMLSKLKGGTKSAGLLGGAARDGPRALFSSWRAGSAAASADFFRVLERLRPAAVSEWSGTVSLGAKRVAK
eukprot:13843107-Heterocapsa_arctica.AAC.1